MNAAPKHSAFVELVYAFLTHDQRSASRTPSEIEARREYLVQEMLNAVLEHRTGKPWTPKNPYVWPHILTQTEGQIMTRDEAQKIARSISSPQLRKLPDGSFYYIEPIYSETVTTEAFRVLREP